MFSRMSGAPCHPREGRNTLSVSQTAFHIASDDNRLRGTGVTLISKGVPGSQGGCLARRRAVLDTDTTPIAGTLPRGMSIPWVSLIELILVLMAVGALVPRFATLGIQETGRDGRFAEAIVTAYAISPIRYCLAYAQVTGRSPRLPCAPVSAGRFALLRKPPGSIGCLQSWPARTLARSRPLSARCRTRRRESPAFRRRVRDGEDDVLALGNTIEAVDAELQPFMRRFSIDSTGGNGPVPLSCAYAQVESALADVPGTPAPDREVQYANALLLLGAALDGDHAVSSLASAAALPAVSRASRRACLGQDLVSSLFRDLRTHGRCAHCVEPARQERCDATPASVGGVAMGWVGNRRTAASKP